MADMHLKKFNHTTETQSTINFNQFETLLQQTQPIRSGQKADVPANLVKSANLIGTHTQNPQLGQAILADLQKAYSLGLVDKNDRLLTVSELNQK